MVFAYYRRLSASQKRVYRQSDEVDSIRLLGAPALRPSTSALLKALNNGDRRWTETICQRLADGITRGLNVPPVRVEVLRVRPHDDWGELHGLYSPEEGRQRACVQLWMRTAHHKRIVAFRTFVRTLLHELCHHLDYELLKLADSFHTEGFYKRLSSLFHQLVESEADT
ncbi:MAG: hypothetical protein ACE5K1_03580 [Acidiferrobacterales bacterium]